MKIGIYGYGIVGKATEVMLHKFYKQPFELFIYDLDIIDTVIHKLKKCKYVFVCVPTPPKEDGTCDTSIVEKAVKNMQLLCSSETVIVVRSTVFPGTTKSLNKKGKAKVIFMPEFLTESTFWSDAENPPFLVIGTDTRSLEILELFINRTMYITDSVTAELLKYSINSFYATKVIFANSMYDIANKIGADWNTIKDIMYQHPFIGPNHLDVMHKGFRGYGGKCLPKDVRAIASGFDNKLLKVIDNINKELLKGANND